jgi:gamma-glutamylcyclotransferase (GGCT)/AIG2-like uncharacterized protein YtfP
MQELLFVYGTLREGGIQERVIGRLAPGKPDILEGYRKSAIKLSGRTYPIISPREGSVVAGEVLALTPEELKRIDGYEGPAYVRRQVTLRSGITAWVYTKNPKR